MLTENSKKYLKRISWYNEQPEDKILEQILHKEWERIRNRELKRTARSQSKYCEKHPEEIELMMKLQGFTD